MLDVLLVLSSQTVVLGCHGCLVACRCLQLTSYDRSVQSALAMITPAECGRLLKSPSSSSGLMAWLWTAASTSQVSQQCLTMHTGGSFCAVCFCCPVASSCLVVRNHYLGLSVCQVCATAVSQLGSANIRPTVQMPDTQPQAILTSDLHYHKGVILKIVTVTNPTYSALSL